MIEVPLGIAIALAMPRQGIWVRSVCLVTDGAADADPLECGWGHVEYLYPA